VTGGPGDGPRLAELIGRPERFFADPDATVRRLAIAAAVERADLVEPIVRLLGDDPDAMVRRECAETLGILKVDDPLPLRRATEDPDGRVREAAVTALGEIGDGGAVEILIGLADSAGEDRLTREASVAALGALGDPAAVPTLLRLIEGAPPQVRRRCVAALSVFDGPEIEAAIRKAATDHNPMVREAAETVVGRTPE